MKIKMVPIETSIRWVILMDPMLQALMAGFRMLRL